MGRKGATEIFKHERTNLSVPTLTWPFPNGQLNAGSWLAPKKNAFIQAISNSDYRAHTAPLFSKLEILDIFQVNTLDTAKFMFRYHNNLPPLFLKLFTTNSQVHRHDTRIASNYRVHSCRKSIKKFSILYQGLRIWNCLPASITNLSSLSIFKNKVL